MATGPRLGTVISAAIAGACVALGVHAGCGTGELNLLPLGPEGGDVATPAEGSVTGDAGADVALDGCPPGLSLCPGGCFDFQNDPQHCGSCTGGCNHGGYCNAATCACLPGNTMCASGACIDLAANPDNCGHCGLPCDAGQSCALSCQNLGGACPAGLTPCPASNSRVECVDMDAGIPYCGSCGNVCGPNQVCATGSCQTYAPATPCTACPCPCDSLVGTPSSCCPGIAGGAQPICVHGASCP